MLLIYYFSKKEKNLSYLLKNVWQFTKWDSFSININDIATQSQQDMGGGGRKVAHLSVCVYIY